MLAPVRKESRQQRPTGRQAEKSAATRLAAIRGAIDCFVEIGYARSSTIEIAKRARVSRGAMIHHFPTKRRLLEACVEYIIDERIRQYRSAIRRSALTREDREAQKGLDVYWNHLHSRLFIAFQELTMASRTDPELARVMRAANARFEREWHEAIKEMFPEWKDRGPLFDLAMDLSQFLLEGMALNKLSHDAERRRDRVRDYLKARLKEIFRAGESAEGDGAVQQFVRSLGQMAGDNGKGKGTGLHA
jgi:AcrR family transcriptional regulator